MIRDALVLVAIAVFAICGVAQAVLFWRLLKEHKTTAAKAWLYLTRFPMDGSLTARGQELRRWWWALSLTGMAAFLLVALGR